MHVCMMQSNLISRKQQPQRNKRPQSKNASQLTSLLFARASGLHIARLIAVKSGLHMQEYSYSMSLGGAHKRKKYLSTKACQLSNVQLSVTGILLVWRGTPTSGCSVGDHTIRIDTTDTKGIGFWVCRIEVYTGDPRLREALTTTTSRLIYGKLTKQRVVYLDTFTDIQRRFLRPFHAQHHKKMKEKRKLCNASLGCAGRVRRLFAPGTRTLYFVEYTRNDS